MEELRNPNLNLDMVKLFVGQIPKDMDEESLRVYFEEFGPLSELSIIRDSANLTSKGCAFVTYRHAESAQFAVEKLHDKVKLPNSLNALQVRIAETQTERENKLFIGMLPKTMNEQDLHAMFITYGELREVHIIRGPDGSPKGCAFVKYVERDAAFAAIEDLNDSIPVGATRPLVVKFADSKKAGKKNEMNYDDNEMFNAQMRKGDFWYPGQQGGGHMQHMRGQPMHAAPQQKYMYPSYPPQPQNRYMYMPGQGGAPPQNYYPPQQSPLGGGGGGVPGGYNITAPKDSQKSPSEYYLDRSQLEAVGGSAYSNKPTNVYPPPPSANSARFDQSSPDAAGAPGAVTTEQDSHTRPPEGPSGANLFIYHLPRDLTDADLATLFAPFGNVISAKVFVDKKTSDSKGFGFVSYDVLESANSAIESMNGFQIGSKRLKVQHKKILGAGGEDESFPYGGGNDRDMRAGPYGGGRGGGGGGRMMDNGMGGGMGALMGGMSSMSMNYPPQHPDMGLGNGMYGGRGPVQQNYSFMDYSRQQQQQQQIGGGIYGGGMNHGNDFSGQRRYQY